MENQYEIKYSDVLSQIKDQENNLLVANGFNYGLGVKTGYSTIFDKMVDNNNIYKEALPLFNQCNSDIEYFIGELINQVDSDNSFLKKHIANNVKFDFMKATHEIVKSNIKNVYAKKNEGVFMLLRNFNNYFTLNYDSLLYLFLLKYSNIDDTKNNALVFFPTIEFIGDDLDVRQNNIYTEIKTARESGKIKISIDNTEIEDNMSNLSKTHFSKEIVKYSKAYNKKWKAKDIDRVINKILKEEQIQRFNNQINDGSRQLSMFDNTEFVFENPETQNLFFLHGAFHIYKEGKFHKKITQKTDKALYDRLEDILNNDEKEIVCVFQRDNKIEAIENDEYLNNCLNKLKQLSGNMVIIGSSLDENDNHIYSNINASNIETIYISATPQELNDKYLIAQNLFPEKNIYMFSTDTISYEMPENIESNK